MARPARKICKQFRLSSYLRSLAQAPGLKRGSPNASI